MTTHELARRVRVHSVRMTNSAHESHLASALSIADIVAVLYNDVLNISCKDPLFAERDRFILSKGHACTAVYAVLAEKGFFPIPELDTFCCNESRLSGHISRAVPGVELSTGSLGHGLGVSAGFALSAKKNGMQYHVYCLMGDGECNEGSVWETAWFASHYKLNNLTAIIDLNRMQAMGFTSSVLESIDLKAKWESFGWKVLSVDGHNLEKLSEAMKTKSEMKPLCILANTVKGKGVSFMENTLLWHYRDPQGDDFIRALAELGE